MVEGLAMDLLLVEYCDLTMLCREQTFLITPNPPRP